MARELLVAFASTPMQPLTAISFELGGSVFAVALQRIVEVALRVDVQPLPGVRPPLLGMVIHRGDITPLLDLASKLDVKRHPPALGDHFLFVRTRQGKVGLEVERVLDVVSVDPLTIVASPEGSDAIAGLAKESQGLTYITDPDAVFAYEQRQDFEDALARIKESA